jgi:hypothetical protein
VAQLVRGDVAEPGGVGGPGEFVADRVLGQPSAVVGELLTHKQAERQALFERLLPGHQGQTLAGDPAAPALYRLVGALKREGCTRWTCRSRAPSSDPVTSSRSWWLH